MNKENNKKYERIAKILIKKSFPILRNKKIFYFEISMKKYYSGLAIYFSFKIILISRNLRKRSHKIITGVIAHELAHLEIYERRRFLKNFLELCLYWISPKTRKKAEYAVNKLVIKKGYAKELYYATKNTELFKRRYGIMKYYPSSKEISNYAKAIGKC